jgi:hypothetical protein
MSIKTSDLLMSVQAHDTSEFAVESISRWWETVGKQTYPHATRLCITRDCGGSNNYRVKMWKYQL